MGHKVLFSQGVIGIRVPEIDMTLVFESIDDSFGILRLLILHQSAKFYSTETENTNHLKFWVAP